MYVKENSLELTTPEGRSFRLKACASFETLRGDTPHDLDVAWQNEGDDRLWLVELKDYGELIPKDPDQTYLEANLTDKIRDTLYVLAAVWSGSAFGQQLRREIEVTFPDFPATACPLRPVVVLNVKEDFKGLFAALMTSLNYDQKLMSTLAVMDVQRITIVDPAHPFVEEQLKVQINVRTP